MPSRHWEKGWAPRSFGADRRNILDSGRAITICTAPRMARGIFVAPPEIRDGVTLRPTERRARNEGSGREPATVFQRVSCTSNPTLYPIARAVGEW